MRYEQELGAIPKEHALSTLKSARAVIDRVQREHQKKADDCGTDVGCFDRVIQILDSEANPQAIRPRRRYQRNGLFVYGEFSERTYDALRQGGDVSANELAEQWFSDRGLDPDADRALWNKVVNNFLGKLGRLKRRNKVERLGGYTGATWRLKNGAAEN